MPLRNPIYLDIDSLLDQAEYADVPVPHAAEISEKATQRKGFGGTAKFVGVGGDASFGKDLEVQTSYTLQPREKASVSKVIDGLIFGGHLVDDLARDAIQIGSLLEVDGVVKLTPTSFVGKIMHVFRELLGAEGTDPTSLDWDTVEPEVMEQLKAIMTGKDLPPLPLLVEVVGTAAEQRVFVNLPPHFFVDDASLSRLEGPHTILGSVHHQVPDGSEGYLSTEHWLFTNWDLTTRKILMTQMDSLLDQLPDELTQDVDTQDVRAWIKGPALVLDAIAIY